jgi:hypothetical protein
MASDEKVVMKYDAGKDPWDLVPWDAVRCVVQVLAFGARKYRPRGWEAGMAWSRLYAALQRHLVAWWNREGVDPDTGYSHLWHAMCCVMFLVAYELRGMHEFDDRPLGDLEKLRQLDQLQAAGLVGQSTADVLRTEVKQP